MTTGNTEIVDTGKDTEIDLERNRYRYRRDKEWIIL